MTTGETLCDPTAIITLFVSSMNYIAQVVTIGSEWTDAAPSRSAPSVFEVYNRAAKLLFPYFWVMVLAGLAIVLGMVLLIVPGVVFAVWFAFSSFFLILGNGKAGADANGISDAANAHVEGVAALKMSKRYVRGIWFEVFVRLAIAALLGLLLNIALAIFKSFVASMMTASVYSAALNNFIDFAYALAVTPYFVVYAYELYMDVMHAHESSRGSALAEEAGEVVEGAEVESASVITEAPSEKSDSSSI